VETITDLLATFINETQRLNVIDRQAIDVVAAAWGWQTRDWTDNAKAAEMGKVLNAQYIVRGTVSRAGDNLLVSARLLDIATADVRGSTNTQLEHMNEAYLKMNGMAQLLTHYLGTQPAQPEPSPQPVQPIQTAQRQLRTADPDTDRAMLNTLGISMGSSISDPVIIITIRGTYAPIRNLFLEAGCDFGFVSSLKTYGVISYSAEKYYSMYLFVHTGLFLPFRRKGGWYIGIGGGYMGGEYTFKYAESKVAVSVFAVDVISGFNIGNFLDISYTARTDFGSFNNKISIGYTYRF